jgi:hypothetical protein
MLWAISGRTPIRITRAPSKREAHAACTKELATCLIDRKPGTSDIVWRGLDGDEARIVAPGGRVNTGEERAKVVSA